MTERVDADLTEMERSILASGLLEWAGPTTALRLRLEGAAA
jgi:hypothetical protein